MAQTSPSYRDNNSAAGFYDIMMTLSGRRHGGYHVHGHLHTRRDEVYAFMSRFDNALNAGCMLNGYRPVTLDELIENNLRFRAERSSEEEEL